MGRTWAIIERELRRFRRSPVLIVMALVMPVVQLVVLGYAFGGNVKHLKVAIVDQDGGLPAGKIAQLGGRVARAGDPRIGGPCRGGCADLRDCRLRRPRSGARRSPQRPGQWRADDPAR